MAHVRRISNQVRVDLHDGWEVHLCAANVVASPSDLARVATARLAGTVPGTVGCALRDADRSVRKLELLDDLDAWYTCSFDAEVPAGWETAKLVFEGLATIADVWLNGGHILRSENMFVRHEVDVTAALRPRNDLCIRFSALTQVLKQRRPRPRWRTKLLDHQQLRWIRTTLFGRVPRLSQPIHAVGPWRPISLVVEGSLRVESADVRTGVEETDGTVHAHLRVRSRAGEVTDALLRVGEHTCKLAIAPQEGRQFELQGVLRIPHVARWWPHTHGPQPLYDVSVHLTADGAPVKIEFGPTGFRTLEVDTRDAGFSVAINGQRIFLRGVNWAPVDITSLTVEDHRYDRPLTLARDAGMNMIRLPGDSLYEADAFYDRCAELGITLWQGFAFALMDYPVEDAQFRESVTVEAQQLLDRLQLNPALTVACGNTDVELQAAMLGVPAEDWKSPLFYELLPRATQQARPDVAYLPSSPTGGVHPFYLDAGVTHYYGVGTYMRPLDDVRRSGVRFASECLAFGNIPEQQTIDAYLANGELPGPYPSWKAGVPREVDRGLDGDDIRDHYVQLLLGEDPLWMRFHDSERYLALGRVAVGEAMALTFAEWRRAASPCNGALVWNYLDFIPGAGWGVIDSFGRPKSAYYYLKRALAPLGLFFSDEGLNGLHVHIVNEGPSGLDAELRIAMYRHGQVRIHDHSTPIHLDPRASLELSVDSLVGRFIDTTYAYRFGPPTHDVTVAELRSASGGTLSVRAFHFPAGMKFPRSGDLGLTARVRRADGGYRLTVGAARFAQAVHIDAPGFIADVNYFHLEPESEQEVLLTPESPGGKALRGRLEALNALSPLNVTAPDDDASPETGS